MLTLVTKQHEVNFGLATLAGIHLGEAPPAGRSMNECDELSNKVVLGSPGEWTGAIRRLTFVSAR